MPNIGEIVHTPTNELPEVPECVYFLPKMRWTDYKIHPSTWVREELLKNGKRLLIADGREVGVIMSVEDYFAMQAVNPNPNRAPLMMRVAGVLYREVL